LVRVIDNTKLNYANFQEYKILFESLLYIHDKQMRGGCFCALVDGAQVDAAPWCFGLDGWERAAIAIAKEG